MVLRGGGHLSFLSGQGFTRGSDRENGYPKLVLGSEITEVVEIAGNRFRNKFGMTNTQRHHELPPTRHPELVSGSKNSKAAFTLAEILITLGIIGIVAAMTLPQLIANYQESVIVKKLSVDYSILSNAVNLMISDYGNELTYDTISRSLKDYLKTTKVCNNAKFCTTVTREMRTPTGHCWMFYEPALVLSNGTLVSISSDVKIHPAIIFVDVNGDKGPNIYDKDTFKFYVTSKGLIPAGEGTGELTQNCLIPQGQTKICNGECAAWVLYQQNMDYLHCTGLNWTSKIKCK